MKGKLCFSVRDHLRGIPHFVQGNQGFHRAQVSFESLFSHASPCLHRPRYLSLENRMLNPKPKTRRDPRMPDRFFMPSGGSSRLPQRLGTAGRLDMAGPGLTRGMHVELPKVKLMQPPDTGSQQSPYTPRETPGPQRVPPFRGLLFDLLSARFLRKTTRVYCSIEPTSILLATAATSDGSLRHPRAAI